MSQWVAYFYTKIHQRTTPTPARRAPTSVSMRRGPHSPKCGTGVLNRIWQRYHGYTVKFDKIETFSTDSIYMYNWNLKKSISSMLCSQITSNLKCPNSMKFLNKKGGGGGDNIHHFRKALYSQFGNKLVTQQCTFIWNVTACEAWMSYGTVLGASAAPLFSFKTRVCLNLVLFTKCLHYKLAASHQKRSSKVIYFTMQ